MPHRSLIDARVIPGAQDPGSTPPARLVQRRIGPPNAPGEAVPDRAGRRHHGARIGKTQQEDTAVSLVEQGDRGLDMVSQLQRIEGAAENVISPDRDQDDVGVECDGGRGLQPQHLVGPCARETEIHKASRPHKVGQPPRPRGTDGPTAAVTDAVGDGIAECQNDAHAAATTSAPMASR